MRFKKLIPGVMRRKILARRRRKNHDSFFERSAEELRELNRKRVEWTKEWIGNRNAEARERVKAIVDRQRLIMAKLAKNGRRFQKLAGLIHELDIPGGLRELKSAISSRRR